MTIDDPRSVLENEKQFFKEQDEGIKEAFAKSDHDVLTTNEIEKHTDLSKRQLNRRLDRLVDEGVLGSRKPGRDKLFWLKVDVREPITIRYPLIGLVKRNVSLQLFLLGVAIGVAAMVVLLSAGVFYTYDVGIPVLSRDEVLYAGFGGALIGGTFIVVATAFGLVELLFRDIDVNDIFTNKD